MIGNSQPNRPEDKGSPGHPNAEKPLVSVVIPAYNEAGIIEKNLTAIHAYMQSLEDRFRWEMIVINDGSTDDTGDRAEAFAKTRKNVYVLHHMFNFRLGQALRYAFSRSEGDYIVVLDLDLSYSPEHVGRMLSRIKETRAKIVIASPFVKEGRISNVPWTRKFFSTWANRFLCLMASKDRFSDPITNITGMVRTYDGPFLRSLDLKATDYNINPEIIYKAKILRARIVEVPAHLDWGPINRRQSSLKVMRNIIQSFMSGFIFRPFMFFIFPGMVLGILSLYPLTWTIIHTVGYYRRFHDLNLAFYNRFSGAIGEAFKIAPHAFIVGGVGLLVAIQLVSLGFLAYQNKRYFEELFHLNSSIYACSQSRRKIESI